MEACDIPTNLWYPGLWCAPVLLEAPIAPTTNPTTHITLTTYNVVSARGTCLLEALRTMQDLNTDIAILTKAKITQNKHHTTAMDTMYLHHWHQAASKAVW